MDAAGCEPSHHRTGPTPCGHSLDRIGPYRQVGNRNSSNLRVRLDKLIEETSAHKYHALLLPFWNE
jgi:hypothetical protein